MLKQQNFVEGVYFGFDFGTKYIGIAVGQTITKTANPLITLKAQNGLPNWQELVKLVEHWQPKGLVVGMPLQLDGSESKTSKLAARFARELKAHTNLPLYTIEERLTSVAASARIKEKRALGAKAQSQDAMAASIILESWFNTLSVGNVDDVSTQPPV